MEQPRSPRPPKPTSQPLRLFVTAFIVVLADQVVKKVVTSVMELGETVDVLGTVARFTRTSNTGAAFGMLRGQSLVFIIVSAAASIAIAASYRHIARLRALEQVAFGLIMGGALGNLVDRIRLGAVVDFINIGIGDLRWPYFNIADSAITIGVAMLAFHILFRPRPEGGSATGGRESQGSADGSGDARAADGASTEPAGEDRR
ncbi:MAG: signal peptidase II, partial [Candidatus Eisenbacteria bacterium]|nr:signal peptidase II [Candidatus Eisenbacteria bacterium]